VTADNDPRHEDSVVEIDQNSAETFFTRSLDDYDHLPGCKDIYARWEKQQWRAAELDFSEDRRSWVAGGDRDRETWMILGRFAAYHVSESEGTNMLPALCAALPEDDQQNCLATQIADEARHDVFFSRFYEEVIAPDGVKKEDLLQELSAPLRYILFDMPEKLMADLKADPGDWKVLTRAVAHAHLIIEGTVSLSVMRSVSRDFKKMQVFPGFSQGYVNVIRDEVRHALIGTAILRDFVAADPALAQIVVEHLNEVLPALMTVLTPTAERATLFASLGKNPYERRDYAIDSLRKRLAAIGIDYTFPQETFARSA